MVRVSDPHWFNADPDTDPDPAFFLIADPDSGSGSRIRIPDPDPGFDDIKLKKNYSWKFNLYFFYQKLQFTYPLDLHKGRPSYRRNLRPSKENIQYLKTWKFWTFFYVCGSFLPSWIRIRNLNADADPDPATQINADPSGSGSETLHMMNFILITYNKVSQRMSPPPISPIYI